MSLDDKFPLIREIPGRVVHSTGCMCGVRGARASTLIEENVTCKRCLRKMKR